VSPVPRCHRSYWGATTSRYASSVAYLLRFRGPRDPPRFVSRNLRSQQAGGAFQAGVIVQPATRTAGLFARGRKRDLPGFQAIRPVPLPRSTTPAEPTIPRLLTVSSMLPPRFPRRRLQRMMNFGAQSRGLGTCCLRFKNGVATHPCKTRFRLAGSPLPGGRRTLWIAAKGFRPSILLFWTLPGAREVSSRSLCVQATS